jgi:hypothetical protein
MYLGTAANACQPECTGKLCGDDGCGGSCGACRAGTACGGWGQCVAASGDTGGGSKPVRLEAESATLCGCSAEAGGDSGGMVTGFEGGDTLCWSNVNLTGLTTATAHVGAPHANGQAGLRFNGTDLGTLTLGTATGGWSSPNLTDVSTAISASGTGTLCLVGTAHPDGWSFSVDYLDLK